MRAGWPPQGKLLVIRLDASGDLLMCTPALQSLRQAGFRLSLLTSSAGALVGARSEALEQVIVFAAPWMKAPAGSDGQATLALAERLRAQAFDGALIMNSYSQSALPAAMLCHLAGIPRQLAYCRENPYQLLSDWLPEPEPESFIRHEVQRQLDLVSELSAACADPRLSLRVAATDKVAAQVQLARLGIAADEPFLLLHPGATAASRRYPLQHWQTLLAQLRQVTALPLVLAGAPDDGPMLMALKKAAGDACAGIVGHLDFGALAALIAKARLLIANNSAPAHLAAAMQTPVVVVYAATNPQHTPWAVPCRVLRRHPSCAPCYRSLCPLPDHPCMEGIAPLQVLAAIRELLQETELAALQKILPAV